MTSKIKSWKDKPRNYEAKMMIESGRGKSQIFRDKRDRRLQEKQSMRNILRDYQ